MDHHYKHAVFHCKNKVKVNMSIMMIQFVIAMIRFFIMIFQFVIMMIRFFIMIIP